MSFTPKNCIQKGGSPSSHWMPGSIGRATNATETCRISWLWDLKRTSTEGIGFFDPQIGGFTFLFPTFFRKWIWDDDRSPSPQWLSHMTLGTSNPFNMASTWFNTNQILLFKWWFKTCWNSFVCRFNSKFSWYTHQRIVITSDSDPFCPLPCHRHGRHGPCVARYDVSSLAFGTPPTSWCPGREGQELVALGLWKTVKHGAWSI